MIHITVSGNLELPKMRMVRQQYDLPPEVEVSVEVEKEWNRMKDSFRLVRGSRVALCVGSRGVTNLVQVVREVVSKLKRTGYEPFVTPAMGSHGGATAEGQIEVLATLGITEAAVGAPVEATMDVVPIGEIDGIPLFMDRLAHESDGIVLINRIKPHTDFTGPTESGLIKMLGIGLGNQVGAEHYHRAAVARGFYEMISTAGKALLKRANVLFGVALVENQRHETTILRITSADDIETTEIELLKKARECMPKLPLDEIDLLIIDEMGKDISGVGIDPNVIGRCPCSWATKRPWPRIFRIFVRDLTEATEGNAAGMGMVDFVTKRLVEKVDMHATAINALTACCPEDGKIPMTFPTDREAIAAALMTIRPYTIEDLRIVHIKNTLELSTLLVSEGCLSDLEQKPNLYLGPENVALKFDHSGDLISSLDAPYEMS